MKFDIEKIKDLNIVTVAADLGLSMKRQGSHYVCLCPWHNDHHNSLVLYQNTNDEHCYCFACGKGGSVLDLVMQVQNCDFQDAAKYLSDTYCIPKTTLAVSKTILAQPEVQPICTIDESYVSRSHSDKSVFMSWLKRVMRNDQAVQKTFDDYQLGATRGGGVIFWQRDAQGRVRSGKIMQFGPDGHRINNPDWIHSKLQKARVLDGNWKLTQCLFGEHLLPLRPEAEVRLVESEKTAVFMSCLQPEYIWVATGGSEQLNANVVHALKGRTVNILPDSGKLKEWRNKLSAMPESKLMHYTFSEQQEKYRKNSDIVDVQLGEVALIVDEITSAQAPSMLYDDDPVIKSLIETFDLTPVDVCPF